MSGTYTITNLQPNTIYNIKTRIRRTDSGLWTESGNLSVATYDIAKITSIPPTTIGNNVTVTYTNPSGNPVEIGLFIDKEDTPIINYQSATGGTHTFEFTEGITAYLYSLTTSSISRTLQFYIKTTQGDKSYSTFTDGVFNVDLELNKPNFNNFDYLDVNPITTGMTQSLEKIVLNYSDIKVKIPVEMRATAKNEAYMLRYEVQCGNVIQTLKYSDYAELEVTFKKATSNVITVKAIDSRGIATTVRKEAEFVNYQSPFISDISFERENGIGTKAFFKINGTWDITHFSRFTNPSEVYFRYKKLNFGEYSPWININGFNGLDVNEYEGTIKNKTDNSNWIPDISKGYTYEKMGENTYDMYTRDTYTDFSGDEYNPNKYLEFEIGVEYNIEFKIVDKLEEYILGNILNSGIPCVDKVKKSDGTYSIGINCFADEKYALKVLGKTNISGSGGGDTLPIGIILPFTSDTIPVNYLLANGNAISRTEYSELFEIIGTTFGEGDSSTTFNLPDLRERVPIGKSDTDINFDEIGKTYGEKEHKLTIAEMPAHGHDISTKANWGGTSSTWDAPARAPANSGNIEQKGNYTYSTGGSQAHNNIQPSLVCNYIIKVKKDKPTETTPLTLSEVIDEVKKDVGIVDNLDGNETTKAPSVRVVNSALEKSVITLYASGRPEVTTTTNFQSIIFGFNKDLKIGSGLTRRTSDGAIIVNEDMYALVSAQVNLFSDITVGEVGIQILVNNEERIKAYYISSTNYNCLTQSPTLLELHKNDVVQLVIRPRNQTTYHFFADDKFCTNLTVQQV